MFLLPEEEDYHMIGDLKHLCLRANTVVREHEPVKVELRVCDAVFYQHCEVLCRSQQCLSVGRELITLGLVCAILPAKTEALQQFLLRQPCVHFKWTP